MVITRFAPSPTGPLHLGHAYSAMLAHDRATTAGGAFLLRIEDIDQTRSRPQWETQIFQDLDWLGLTWQPPVLRQSDRSGAYLAALDRLANLGVTYPCRCNRADIEAAASAPQEGVPQFGPDGRIYPGTCRNRDIADQRDNDVIRLNMVRAAELIPKFSFTELGPVFSGTYEIETKSLCETAGDVILRRRGMLGSYHLSVVVDDADQSVTEVTRGADLFDATPIHVLLQSLLELPTPAYYHHDLIRDDAGKRLAKRDDARAIATYRDGGATAQEIRKMLGL